MLKLLKKIFSFETEQQRVDKYLSHSVDIHDLEARMRALQEADRRNHSMINYYK